MTRKSSLKATAGAVALIALAAGGASACGRAGSLERPGPMFGLARADDQPQRQAGGSSASDAQSRNTTATGASDAGARSRPRTGNTTDDDDSNVPTTGRDIRDPAQRLTPLSASPIQGLSDPLGPPVSTKPPG